jgi:ParB family chromosome partitioning protein
MGKKSGLGRRLGNILEDKQNSGMEFPGADDLKISKIKLDQIDTNPFQPRTVFKQEEIEELAASILEHGIIQPIVLRKHAGRYQIIAGERRFRACQFLEQEEIEARVFETLSDRQMAEWALIENIQRVELNPVEEARSFQQLLQDHGYTHDKLAARLGKSRSAISNQVRLLNLPDQVLQWLSEGKLSTGHARSLLSPEIQDPEAVAQEIIEKGLNVREAEKKTRPAKKTSTNPQRDPNLEQLEQDLQYSLGTKVSIQEKKGKGKIIVEFTSPEDLNRLLRQLQNQG